MSRETKFNRAIAWRLPERVPGNAPFVRIDLLDGPTIMRLVRFTIASHDTAVVTTAGEYAVVGIPRTPSESEVFNNLNPEVLLVVRKRDYAILDARGAGVDAGRYLRELLQGRHPVPGLAMSRGIVLAIRQRGGQLHRGYGGSYLIPEDADVCDIVDAIESVGGQVTVVPITHRTR